MTIRSIEDMSTGKYIESTIQVGYDAMHTDLQNDLFEMIQAALIEHFPIPKLKKATD